MGKLIKLLVVALIVGLLGVFVEIQYPSPIDSCNFQLPPPPVATGCLARNNLLKNTTKLFGNKKLHGLRAEAFTSDNQSGFYSGLGDGTIAHLRKGSNGEYELIEIRRTGKDSPDCGAEEFEKYCGRPLGLLYDTPTHSLFIADTLGLLHLDLTSNVLTTLADSFEGKPILFANSVVISKNRELYFTDSSDKFPRSTVMYEVIEGCARGRLFKYDLLNRQLTLLASNLHFPNGLQLTNDETALLFSETTRSRIMKYHIKDGQITTFLENCPGFPDNIKYSHPSKVYWVGLSSSRLVSPAEESLNEPKKMFGGKPLLDMISGQAWLRNLVLRFVKRETITANFPRYGLAIAVDLEGNIVHTLHDPTGEIGFISEVEETEDSFLILGSWRNDFVGFLDGSSFLPLIPDR